jgi:hypothetical protein
MIRFSFARRLINFWSISLCLVSAPAMCLAAPEISTQGILYPEREILTVKSQCSGRETEIQISNYRKGPSSLDAIFVNKIRLDKYSASMDELKKHIAHSRQVYISMTLCISESEFDVGISGLSLLRTSGVKEDYLKIFRLKMH